MQTILMGLASTFFWGTSDFYGGLVSRRIGAVRATLAVQAVGLLPVLLIAVLSGQMQMTLADWAWSGIAGVVGSLGFVALYQALAEGQMSTAAPVAALISASFPVLVGLLQEGLPSGLMLAGFGLALAGVWFLAQADLPNAPKRFQWKELRLAFLAGLGLGAYYVLIHQGSHTNVFTPMVAVRGAGAVILFVFAARQGELRLPPPSIWPLMILNTVLDIGGSLFYILAGQSGRMDLAALLASLYPGVTAGLAWLILREKVGRKQQLGVLMTLAAIALITH